MPASRQRARARPAGAVGRQGLDLRGHDVRNRPARTRDRRRRARPPGRSDSSTMPVKRAAIHHRQAAILHAGASGRTPPAGRPPAATGPRAGHPPRARVTTSAADRRTPARGQEPLVGEPLVAVCLRQVLRAAVRHDRYDLAGGRRPVQPGAAAAVAASSAPPPRSASRSTCRPGFPALARRRAHGGKTPRRRRRRTPP